MTELRNSEIIVEGQGERSSGSIMKRAYSSAPNHAKLRKQVSFNEVISSPSSSETDYNLSPLHSMKRPLAKLSKRSKLGMFKRQKPTEDEEVDVSDDGMVETDNEEHIIGISIDDVHVADESDDSSKNLVSSPRSWQRTTSAVEGAMSAVEEDLSTQSNLNEMTEKKDNLFTGVSLTELSDETNIGRPVVSLDVDITNSFNDDFMVVVETDIDSEVTDARMPTPHSPTPTLKRSPAQKKKVIEGITISGVTSPLHKKNHKSHEKHNIEHKKDDITHDDDDLHDDSTNNVTEKITEVVTIPKPLSSPSPNSLSASSLPNPVLFDEGKIDDMNQQLLRLSSVTEEQKPHFQFF